MNTAGNKIIKFLSSSFASISFLVIAILSRVVNVCFVSYAGRDKMFLVMQSKSFLEGKGLVVPGYLTSNPDVVVYDHTPMWPYGYPIVLSPFLKIFNYDIYWSTTALDIIACVALIFVVRKLCKQIGFPVAAVNLMTLVIGCFEYTFINDSKPTDNIPIVLFLLGISLLIKNLALNRLTLGSVFLAAFVLFLPSTFRYSYPPLSIAVAISVLFVGSLKKDILLKKKGAWLLLFVFVLNLFFSVAMKLFTGYAGYAVPTARGYFPESLIHWFPIVPSSFINLSFLSSQTNNIAGITLESTMRFLEIINVICIISIVAVFISLFFNKKFLSELTPFKWFLITGFFASAATFASLIYLSFTYAPQKWGEGWWTYLYDHRYYVFVVIFLQIIFLGWVFLCRDLAKKIWAKIIIAACSLALFIEVTHNIYFHTKVAFNFSKYKSEVYREQDYAYFFTLIKELEKKYPDLAIWTAASGDDFYPYVATYYGHTGIMDGSTFQTKNVAVKRKTILVFMFYDADAASYKNFLSQSNILFSKKIDISNYYVIELLP